MDSFVEIPEAELEKMLQVNLMGVYRVNKAFLPFLQKRLASGQAPAPRILIVTSELAAFAPLPFNGIYGMTKTALDSYSCSLAMELELLGIRVVTLRPGAFGEGMPRASVKEMERMSAASRLYPEVAAKFRSIVLSETGSAKDPALFACRVVKLLEKKRPAFVYRQNNSIKLKLFSLLPVGLRAALLKKLLS